MSEYRFEIVDTEGRGPLADPEVLRRRPFVAQLAARGAEQAGGEEEGRPLSALELGARKFIADSKLTAAVNAALAVGDPLLVTGESGTGKTQAAYWAAWRLGLEPVLHFQVKSDSAGRDLLYRFDAVNHFRDAQLRKEGEEPPPRSKYVHPGKLAEALTSERPRVLLIDEIDKAPKDFPNDLLHELDQMEIQIPESGQTLRNEPENRPLVVITSNSERRLPAPFLRRCVYHHIRFDDELLERIIEAHRDEFAALDESFVKLAMQRFLALRQRELRKQPATGELLVWLRVLAAASGTYPKDLDKNLSALPYLGTLLKDHRDIEGL